LWTKVTRWRKALRLEGGGLDGMGGKTQKAPTYSTSICRRRFLWKSLGLASVERRGGGKKGEHL